MIGGVRPEVPQRVLTADRVVPKAPRPVCAEDDRAVVGARHDEADSGVTDQGGDQAGVKLVDLTDGHPLRALGEIDQAKAT
jgi:hypothetical protein